MGWFWADAPIVPKHLSSHPVHSSDAVPPLGCPMHAHPSPTAARSSSPSGGCPVKHSNEPKSRFSGSSCPVKTPVDASHQSQSSSTLSKLNPLNYMPSNLSQSRAKNQTVSLPVEREISSIPRGDADSNWEYPSPQQMYNAMLRKGYDDTPEDAVESMVAVHNFLNEGAWAEIVEWEQTFAGGLIGGWRKCKANEKVPTFDSNVVEAEELPKPRLLRFQGRPKDMTPKATILQLLGQVYPSKFGTEPPFDRHDWFVQRQTAAGGIREVRYVIDYYSAPPEPTGEPVFYLDVRPAVDGPTAAMERLMKWGSGIKPLELWAKASGRSAREQTS